MSAETKTVEFENFSKLKDHINEKADALRKQADEFNALLKSSFGEFPRDALSLVQFIERVIDLRQLSEKKKEISDD